MKILWAHIQRCRKENCSFPQCVSSQNVLAHFKGCKNLRCPLCGPILVVARRTDVVASSQLPSQKEVHHFASTGLVPQPRRSEDSSRPEESSSSSSSSNHNSNSNKQVHISSSSSSSVALPGSASAPIDLTGGDMKGKSYKKRMFSRDELEKNKYSYSKIHCSDSNASTYATIPRLQPPPICLTVLQHVENPQLSENSTAIAKSVLKKTWRVRNLGPYPWPQSIMFAFEAGDRLEFLSNASWAAVTPGDLAGDRYFSVHIRVPEVSGRHITLFRLLSHGNLQIQWTGRRMKLQLSVTGGEAPQSSGSRLDALDLLARAASEAEADLEERDQEQEQGEVEADEWRGVPAASEMLAAVKKEDGYEDDDNDYEKDDEEEEEEEEDRGDGEEEVHEASWEAKSESRGVSKSRKASPPPPRGRGRPPKASRRPLPLPDVSQHRLCAAVKFEESQEKEAVERPELERSSGRNRNKSNRVSWKM